MRSALDDLHVGRFQRADGGGARREKVGGGDESGDDEGDGREEPEGVLEAHDGAVHCGGGTGSSRCDGNKSRSGLVIACCLIRSIVLLP